MKKYSLQSKYIQLRISLVASAFIVSLIFHFASIFSLKLILKPKLNAMKPKSKTEFVKLKLTKPKQPQKVKIDPRKQVVETELKKTKAPTEKAFLGKQNHQTKNETKVAKSFRPKAADLSSATPGSGGKKNKSKANAAAVVSKAPKKRQPLTGNGIKMKSDTYRALLLHSQANLMDEMKLGYQEYVDAKLKESRTIDLNTVEYRYIGYFTNLRKAIELAWIYPQQARVRGIDGKVMMGFTINKDGSVREVQVKESSGYKILDQAIVEAINMAAPFAPLPKSSENTLPITGVFHYTLN